MAGDTNAADDVFIRDRQTGATTRISVGAGGVQANSRSFAADVSASGQFVVFHSDATNLVSGDTNGARDVFVRDRQAAVTRRVSLGEGGVQANGSSQLPEVSADGRVVAFESQATNLVAGDTSRRDDVYVRNWQSGVIRRVSVAQGAAEGNHISFKAAVSGDGRFVAFSSHASNLVAGDTDGVPDVFIRDPFAP